MKKRALYLIIGLMSLSALGLIGLQAYWVSQAWKAEEARFNDSVNAALNRVVNQLERQEMAGLLKKHYVIIPEPRLAIDENKKAENAGAESVPNPAKNYKNASPAGATNQKSKITAKINRFERPAVVTFDRSGLPMRRPDPKIISDSLRKPGRRLYIREDENLQASGQTERKTEIRVFRYTTADSLIKHRLSADSILANRRFRALNKARQPDSISRISFFYHDSLFNFRRNNINFKILNLPKAIADSIRKSYQTVRILDREAVKEIAPKPIEASISTEQKMERKQTQASQTMQQMVAEMVRKDVPLKERINIPVADSLLSAALSDFGIRLPYKAVFQESAGQNNFPVSIERHANNNLEKNMYKVGLFPNDLNRNQASLLLSFPGKPDFLLQSLWLMLTLSGVFTFIMLATFGITLHFIFRQKRLAEIKSDFINNMTHEFKTPIATIGLATDAINSPKVLSNPDRIGYYSGIIKQENNRMLSQVENVLQMAVLDRQELKLNPDRISLDELINQCTDKLKLQVEARNGTILIEKPAGEIFLNADKFHLANAILNLLDNANKYSPEKPEIRVNLQAGNRFVTIGIADKGIGIKREEHSRIFDKFFRISTGNVHDVKGFGLGLSYVKTITELHGGRLSVTSSPGKGSLFQMVLPLN